MLILPLITTIFLAGTQAFEFVCPAERGHFPHPSDCTVFYKCREGHPYRYKCPVGLIYHQEFKLCFIGKDDRCPQALSEAQQQLDNSITESDNNLKVTFVKTKESSDQEKITSKATIENSEVTMLNNEATTLIKTDNEDNIVFPDENGENNISDDFRRPDNRHKWWRPNPATTPSPWWNPSTSTTPKIWWQPSSNAWWSPQSTTSSPWWTSTSTLRPWRTSTTTLRPWRPSAGPTNPWWQTAQPSTKPPSVYNGVGCVSNEVYGDPKDCSSFIKCADGEKHTFKCPAGLLFDNSNLVCEWPENVKCGSNGTTLKPPTTIGTRPTYRPTTRPTTSRPTTSRPITTRPTSVEFPSGGSGSTSTTTFTPGSTTSSNCNSVSSEPITPEIEEMRRLSCLAPNSIVDQITPGSPSNPDNVKIVESIFSSSDFSKLFPEANKAYTYQNFLKAIGKFPSICSRLDVCKKTLATMFAHFQQETAGLFYLKEINKSGYCASWSAWINKAYPCIPGKQYFGRGSKQLSWNYNYGAFSEAMFGDSKVLLNDPDQVSDTWLNFASAIWFYVTPQPPKPSMMAVVDGSWKPNTNDKSKNLLPGFGVTTMIINGALECGPSPSNQNASKNRQKWYREYAKHFGFSIANEKIDCRDMKSFDGSGSSNPALYWAPESGCKLATWQTAYSALIEGNYARCKAEL